jgi:lysophospholipase L1-like esterase
VLSKVWIWAALCVVFVGFPALSFRASAQAAPAGQNAAPAQTAASAQNATGLSASGHPANAYWTAHDKQLLTDFGWLARYKDPDGKLGPPAPGENRVVFMGDSITEGWHFDGPAGFTGKPYVNRGISGQTSPQMLVRFRQDVVDLKPKVVVILAGTNDIAGNTGPMTLEQSEENIASMADLANSNHINVVLCSVLPAFDFLWQPGMEPAPKILALNTWMRQFAADHGYVYVDYHSAMKDERNGLPAALSKDGVHPTEAGYAVMKPLVEAGIGKALEK